MYCQKALLILLAAHLIGALSGKPPATKDFSGQRALEFTRRAVSFGARPAGSPAIRRLQGWLIAQLKSWGCEVLQDDFTAQTPNGPTPMKNIIARFGGRSGRAVMITGHYDTKVMPGINFIGADDGGSSAGFLLEMAEVLATTPHKDDVYLIWFDGEEAVAHWTDTDSLYGSRHLAQTWASYGALNRIKALINVDMIGDRELGILPEANSTPWLRTLVWNTAVRLGYGKYFLSEGGPVEDDHMPFVKAGVSALDLIDFDKSYWHTAEDTPDKLSAHSLEVVGNVLVTVIRELEGMP